MPRIVELFDRLAEWTWGRLLQAHERGVSQGETTITDSLLLDIAAERLPGIRVCKATQAQEGLFGFDWEWWVRTNRQGWIQLVVQAKKYDLRTRSYPYLKHIVGGRYQIDLLEEYAQEKGAGAFYCFYNHPGRDESNECWSCPRDFVEAQFGCSIVPLDVVRRVHDPRVRKSFRRLHDAPTALPWRCLFEDLTTRGRWIEPDRGPNNPDDVGVGDNEPPEDHDDGLHDLMPDEKTKLPDYLAMVDSPSMEGEVQAPPNESGVYPRRIMIVG